MFKKILSYTISIYFSDLFISKNLTLSVGLIMDDIGNDTILTEKIKDISIKKYKQILWDKVKDMLEITDYNIAKIKQDLLYENENIIITGNSRK